MRKDPALTADDVKKYCRTQLTGYKMPREIIFVDSLPKTAVGKILRRELKGHPIILLQPHEKTASFLRKPAFLALS